MIMISASTTCSGLTITRTSLPAWIENLEAISNSVKGVASSFAIQAGREVRVIVNPEEVDDLATISIARQIKEEIENKLSYPGTIKVTVVREVRAVDVAK